MAAQVPKSDTNPGRWARSGEVRKHLGGISNSALWAAVRNGHIPAPSYLAPRVPLWRLSEIDAVIVSRRFSEA